MLQSVQYTINPLAGFSMALRCMNVILGNRKPLVDDFTSSMAEGCDGLPSVLMLT
jgi:hypothetical protein